ncbi:MAG TPA: diguanylate cyclase [Ramlibacter sp.]|nr:diguanylate cyclase [Ramlibacter sp.]
MQEPARLILMYLVFPLWVAAGFIDWACHRRTHIELTSGLKENLMHWLLFAEIGVGMLAVVLLELNAAVLALVAVVFVLHELTVYWDLHYTTPKRRVGPFEQMVHSFLELLPLLSLALLAAMAWPQALAMVGLGDVAADWSLGPKRDPLPVSYLVGAFVLASVCNGLPLLQETWACLQARARARTPARPAPR